MAPGPHLPYLVVDLDEDVIQGVPTVQEQLHPLDIIDLRFRQTTRLSDEELRAYYNKLVAERPQADAPSFEDSRPQIEELLLGERALDALDEWLKTARARARIEYREQVFQ